MPPNPRIIRALEQAEITGNDHSPVDTSNSNLIPTGLLPSLTDIKKRLINKRVGKRMISYQLRFLYIALFEWFTNQDYYTYRFVTVHFDSVTEARLMNGKKGPVVAYSDRLRKSLAALPHSTEFFFVLERGSTVNKRLHAHVLIAFHKEDLDSLKPIFSKGATQTGSGLDISNTFELIHSAQPGTSAYEMLELEEEHGCCSYKKNKKGKYVVELPLSIGAADYMSKDLSKRLAGHTGRRFYATSGITSIANARYNAAYKRQQVMQKKEKQEEKLKAANTSSTTVTTGINS